LINTLILLGVILHLAEVLFAACSVLSPQRQGMVLFALMGIAINGLKTLD
jgi:hypothetical protein